MNEELIRQCAEEACGPEWYGPKPNIMRGAGERAIRLYHARHVAPLVEAADNVLMELRRGHLQKAVENDLAEALAPFGKEAKHDQL